MRGSVVSTRRPSAVRTVTVFLEVRLFQAVATSGGSRRESIPGWWFSRSFQKSFTRW